MSAQRHRDAFESEIPGFIKSGDEIVCLVGAGRDMDAVDCKKRIGSGKDD